MSANKRGNIKKAGLGYTIGNYLIKGIGFLTLPLFTRLMSTSDFGIYNTYTSYESILFVFVGVAIHSSYKNANLKYESEFEKYVSNSICIQIISMLMFLIGGLILSLFTRVESWYASVLVIHGFASAIIVDYNAYLGINYRAREYLKISVFDALGNIIISFALIMTVFSMRRGIGRIVGTVLPKLAISIYIIVILWKKNKPKINYEQAKYALTYSIPIIPHGISQVILASSDKIMIASIVGDAEAGIYSFSYTLYALFSVMYSSLNEVWSPWFYENYRKDKKIIRIVTSKYIKYIALLSIGLILISPEIIRVMGPDEYLDSQYLVVPIVIGGFFSFLYTFPATVEYYCEKTRYIAFGTGCAAGINVLLNLFFIPRYGYTAAAYTTLATYFLYFCFHYALSIRILKGKHLYDMRFIVIAAFIVVCMGVIAQIFIGIFIIRWGLAIIDAVILIFYFDKDFHIWSKIKGGNNAEIL